MELAEWSTEENVEDRFKDLQIREMEISWQFQRKCRTMPNSVTVGPQGSSKNFWPRALHYANSSHEYPP